MQVNMPSGVGSSQSLNYQPASITVVIGKNNTVQWVNTDSVAHTVSSFLVPSGAQTFNSDLIQPDHGFTVTLSVPGVYKYTCMWHPWLRRDNREIVMAGSAVVD